DLLEREDLVAPEPFEPLRGHAVRAPEVALVRDGDPYGLDSATPAVDERFHVSSVPAFCRNTAETTPLGSRYTWLTSGGRQAATGTMTGARGLQGPAPVATTTSSVEPRA